MRRLPRRGRRTGHWSLGAALNTHPLLTTREVAELLAVSPATILRRVAAGELPAFRLASNALRFRADEIDAWLEARREKCPLQHSPGWFGAGVAE